MFGKISPLKKTWLDVAKMQLWKNLQIGMKLAIIGHISW
jgi:hypothetical protein